MGGSEQDVASVVSKMTTSTASTSSLAPLPFSMIPSVVVGSSNGTPAPSTRDAHYRAVHQIRLKALAQNYSCVESAANQQRCSVIVVVKADGYGHGAIATALYLADVCGADAFAVATLEEAVALRRALVSTRPETTTAAAPAATASYPDVLPIPDTSTLLSYRNNPSSTTTTRSRRPPHIRILVLGPPVGYPRCFDDYFYHNIEVMVSGPEVACALLEWVTNAEERKRTLVERAAHDAKQQALQDGPGGGRVGIMVRQPSSGGGGVDDRSIPLSEATLKQSGASDSFTQSSRGESTTTSKTAATTITPAPAPAPPMFKMSHPAATLSNVSGQDLAKEVRNILMNQKAAAVSSSTPGSRNDSGRNTPAAAGTASPPSATNGTPNGTPLNTNHSSLNPTATTANGTSKTAAPAPMAELFGGIEAVAKDSRTRQMAAAKAVFVEDQDNISLPNRHSNVTDQESVASSLVSKTRTMARNVLNKRKLRWHALVDSGMGRLGFKTEPGLNDNDGRKDTVDILKEMVDAEVHDGAPIEFYGMCTHMAEANSSSDYTNSQIAKFKYLLKRVRNADISVPTVSTDNSAALLTTNLKHFDADEILTQPHSHTRGYVRTGGAIYGQRPAFSQLRAVSTLKASVRHVAVLKAGETVGYDRAYQAPMDVRIATLTIGFADGYPRELGNGVGKVSIRGAVFPVAGNVCMDMLMVELGAASDVDGIGARVVVGDVAILWGPEDDEDGEGLVRLQDLATTLKTTQSALTCGLDKIRVLREYTP